MAEPHDSASRERRSLSSCYFLFFLFFCFPRPVFSCSSHFRRVRVFRDHINAFARICANVLLYFACIWIRKNFSPEGLAVVFGETKPNGESRMISAPRRSLRGAHHEAELISGRSDKTKPTRKRQ